MDLSDRQATDERVTSKKLEQALDKRNKNSDKIHSYIISQAKGFTFPLSFCAGDLRHLGCGGAERDLKVQRCTLILLGQIQADGMTV